MRVLKRNGSLEAMCLDKISTRLKQLVPAIGALPALNVDHMMVAQKTCAGLFDGISTSEIDRISSEVAVSLVTTEPDYEAFAARIAISNLHKQTSPSVVETFTRLAHYVNERGEAQPLVTPAVLQAVKKNGRALQRLVDYDQDFSYSYFGLKTLLKGYLLGPAGRPIERPQHMLLRVAVGIWPDDASEAAETYRALSAKLYTHATPTLFNMGTPNPASASCYLLGTGDSVEALYDTLKQCALISKNAGGIGLHVSNVRGTGALIRGTGGQSNGLVPLARTFNQSTRLINQGGKRNGALALYLEPWHVDVFEFVQLRRPQGAEDLRARDIFLALWLNDLFFERLEADGQWSLMDPDACPGLPDAWGPAFRELYEGYEAQGRYVRRVRAQDLWTLVLQCQLESGLPYCLNKDAVNAKSNQQHLGTIKSSNLCSEICEVSDASQTSVCNLASVALPYFVADGRFDLDRLHRAVQRVIRNLDRMLDMASYPVDSAKATNLRDRPLGVGVQGLADTFIALRLPFRSDGAAKLNRDIFETMYHAALTASTALAAERGRHPSYEGSPASLGRLQFDMWDQCGEDGRPHRSTGLDWAGLRTTVAEQGLRNSLLVALMPTCSTSQILGCNESFQPLSSVIYSRRTGAGTFVCVAKQLVKDLQALGLWGGGLKDEIIRRDGSVQGIAAVPADLQELYRTVWEIPQRCCIDLAADRAPFVDQSQSMNLFLADHSYRKMSAMLLHGWRRGLKTLSYYMHVRAEAKPVQVTLGAAQDCQACAA